MRTFTSNFLAQAAARASAPYHLLEIAWAGGSLGTSYFLDRATTGFLAAGSRCPSTIHPSRVTDWGSCGLSLKESQVGGVDSRTIELDNADLLSEQLQTANQQRSEVNVWRLFDHSSTVWPTDAALVFSGALKPWSWKIDGNRVTLPVEDASSRLFKTVSHRAAPSIFPQVQEPFKDRHLPIVLGNAERVEAVLVSEPWETRILENAGGGREPSPSVQCFRCAPGTTPNTVKVVYSGFTNGTSSDCANLNFIEALIPHAGSCSWHRAYPSGSGRFIGAAEYAGTRVSVNSATIEVNMAFQVGSAPFNLIFRIARVPNSSCEWPGLAVPYSHPLTFGSCNKSAAIATLYSNL